MSKLALNMNNLMELVTRSEHGTGYFGYEVLIWQCPECGTEIHVWRPMWTALAVSCPKCATGEVIPRAPIFEEAFSDGPHLKPVGRLE